MKMLKSSPLHLSLLPYLMGLLFLFSAYPTMAGPKQAQGGDKIYNFRKYFTFRGSSDLVATSTQPSIIFFSRVRDNPENNTFYSNTGGSISPFHSLTNWINTNITEDSGYSFRGLTCSNCSPVNLLLDFYLDQSKLTKTNQVSASGDTIFQLKEHPELGVSFQLGTQHRGYNAYLPSLNFDVTGTAKIGGVQLYFGDSVSIVFLLRARLHLLENPKGNKTIPQIDLNLGHIKLLPLETKPKKITFVIHDEGQINVRLKTPQVQLFEKTRECFLTSSAINPSSVTLKSVKKSAFDNTNEIEGGEFKLRVSCNKEENNKINKQWLFPHVMITFKGEQDTKNDGSSDLLKTQKGDGQAKGVSLRIKRQGGDSVKYGQDSPQMGNAGQFAVHKQPSVDDRNARETFKVYYVKDSTRGDLTEGKVNAAATFTMSYQ